jgi:hypothetical protein
VIVVGVADQLWGVEVANRMVSVVGVVGVAHCMAVVRRMIWVVGVACRMWVEVAVSRVVVAGQTWEAVRAVGTNWGCGTVEQEGGC